MTINQQDLDNSIQWEQEGREQGDREEGGRGQEGRGSVFTNLTHLYMNYDRHLHCIVDHISINTT